MLFSQYVRTKERGTIRKQGVGSRRSNHIPTTKSYSSPRKKFIVPGNRPALLHLFEACCHLCTKICLRICQMTRYIGTPQSCLYINQHRSAELMMMIVMIMLIILLHPSLHPPAPKAFVGPLVAIVRRDEV